MFLESRVSSSTSLVDSVSPSDRSCCSGSNSTGAGPPQHSSGWSVSDTFDSDTLEQHASDPSRLWSISRYERRTKAAPALTGTLARLAHSIGPARVVVSDGSSKSSH